MITCRSPDIRTGLSTKEVDVVVTPRVREEVRYQLWMAFRPIFFAQVRKHFGCDKLSGAELEDQGEEGTALTHWEKRLFENEAMTGTHTQVYFDCQSFLCHIGEALTKKRKLYKSQ